MQKKQIAEMFGSSLEIAAAFGFLLHVLITLTKNVFTDTLSGDGVSGARDLSGGEKDTFLLLFIAALLYAGLTGLGFYPHRLNYLWKADESYAGRQSNFARNFLREIKVELMWLFALISLPVTDQNFTEISGFINFSIFLLIIIISVTVIGYLVIASRFADKETI